MSTVKVVVELGLPITAIGAATSGGPASVAAAGTTARLSNGSWLSRSRRMMLLAALANARIPRRSEHTKESFGGGGLEGTAASKPPLPTWKVSQNKIAKQLFRL